MKFYGIDMQGKFFVEEADINPAANEFDRRLVRDTDGRLYIGDTGVGHYVEIITDFDYSSVGGIPTNIQQAFQAEFHPVGGDDTTSFKSPLYVPETGENSIKTSADWYYVAVGSPLDAVGDERWGGLLVEVTPVGDQNNDAAVYYDGSAGVDSSGYGHDWRLSGPNYSPTEQIIATREWVASTTVSSTDGATQTWVNSNFYTKAQSDAKYMVSANANARAFDNFSDQLVYDDAEGADVSTLPANATRKARIAQSGGVYSNALGANHTVKRNGSGNIYANVGYLTATAALYADLAEKYTCDPTLPVGTVVAVPVDGYSDYEVVPFDFDNAPVVVGVVSEAPAYLMNQGSEGLPIGLTGKVPVRVVGEIKKGDFIVPSAMEKGCAIKGNPETNFNKKIGIALETNLQDGEKLVKCIIK